jgi:DNA-binding transcriptional ArsR family regulator
MIRPIDIIPAKARLFRSVGDEGRLSAVSTHLAALNAAGLVSRRAAGREAWYALAHPTVGALLDAAEDVVIAASGETYACTSPCCAEPEPAR